MIEKIKKILYYPLVVEILLGLLSAVVVYVSIELFDFPLATVANWVFPLIIVIIAFFIRKSNSDYNKLNQKIFELNENILITQVDKGGDLYRNIMADYKNQLKKNANRINKKEKLVISNSSGSHHYHICKMVKEKKISSLHTMECFVTNKNIENQIREQHKLDIDFMTKMTKAVDSVDSFDFKWLIVINNQEHIKDYIFYKEYKNKYKFKSITIKDFNDILNSHSGHDVGDKKAYVHTRIERDSLDIAIYLGNSNQYVFDGHAVDDENIEQWGIFIANEEIIEFYKELFNEAWEKAKDITSNANHE